MENKRLEEEVRPVKPIVDEAMHRVMGITIDELSRDISDKLKTSPLLIFDISTKLGFKKAKKEFVKRYMKRLLQVNYGNISEVAKIADVDRRSIHRIVRGGDIDVEKIRRDMAKAYNIKQSALNEIIESVLDNYKTVIHPEKLGVMYRNVPEFSRDILEAMPEKQLTMKEAEEEFEKEFIRKALAENGNNMTITARKIRLRYETLLRKMKRYEM